MKLTLAEPKYLKDSITVISELVAEARFKITKNAMELVAMDPANVAMVVFKLLSSTFTEYDVKEEVDISINLSNFKQILKRAKPNDTLTLELEEGKLKIEFKGNSKRTFFMPIIDTEDKEQRVPELNFTATIKTATSVFDDAIADVDIVADSVTFFAEKGKFIVSAEGDLNQANVEIKEDNQTKIETTAPAKAKYSVEYLKKMINGSKLADQVTIHFNKDYPLKLEYKTIDKLQLAFILAPRVEND